MSFALFSYVGMMLVLKFFHVGVGALWVGSNFYAPTDLTSEKKNKFIFWIATATLITGLLHIAGNYSLSFYSSWGVSMLLGSALGMVMWFNLFCVMRPAQRKGDQRKAEIFSYTNILLSLPMLFFMEMASHLGLDFNAQSERWILILALALPVILIELYAVIGKGPQVTNLRRSLLGGVVLLGLQYATLEMLSK